jgi:pyruvate/2-oxoglutarate dehydrogenase complex dihydrolipoamide dehydrogenase (E3) component
VAGRSVAVVGAGRCGLLASTALAEASCRVTLVERLPSPGGQEPERPEAEELASRAECAGVEFELGTLGVRWTGTSLQTLGVAGAADLDADRLLVTTGSRPATRAELGIAGDRSAGIFPGSAALHIVESGVLVGRRPVIVGTGSLAATLVSVLKHAGAEEVTVVAPEGPCDARISAADRIFSGWHVLAAHGGPRVQAVELVRGPGRADGVRVFCDALILAHRRIPMRNVEGAIHGGANVAYCQSEADPKSAHDAEACAEGAVERLLAELAQDQKEE